MSDYRKLNGLEVTLGNLKLGEDTLVFNMGSCANCPSKRLGLCSVTDCCYAGKAERLYPDCLPYRTRQESFWLNHSKTELVEAFRALVVQLKRGGKPLYKSLKWFRFNEAGDLHSQQCVTKLRAVAEMLLQYGIRTYGYTARKDLDLTPLCNIVNIKGSGFYAPGGRTRVVRTVEPQDLMAGEFLCPGNCRRCNVCKQTDVPVVFLEH